MQKADSNREQIEAILKATETSRGAPKAAVEAWNKLDKLKSHNIKKLSGQYQLNCDYDDLDVAANLKIDIGENGSGIYMGTIQKAKPHGVGRFASDCNQSILEG